MHHHDDGGGDGDDASSPLIASSYHMHPPHRHSISLPRHELYTLMSLYTN